MVLAFRWVWVSSESIFFSLHIATLMCSVVQKAGKKILTLLKIKGLP